MAFRRLAAGQGDQLGLLLPSQDARTMSAFLHFPCQRNFNGMLNAVTLDPVDPAAVYVEYLGNPFIGVEGLLELAAVHGKQNQRVLYFLWCSFGRRGQMT